MMLLRQELRSFSSACEVLLSAHSKHPFADEEQEVILYYVNELYERFDQKPEDRTRLSPPALAEKSRRSTLRIDHLELEDGVLNAAVSGEFELSAAERQFVELLHEAVKTGATYVLIDGEQITGNLKDYERFLYGEFAAWATLDVLKRHNIMLKFAYLIHEPLRDPDRFGETVAVNRGMRVKAFEEKDEAIQWLKRGE